MALLAEFTCRRIDSGRNTVGPATDGYVEALTLALLSDEPLRAGCPRADVRRPVAGHGAREGQQRRGHDWRAVQLLCAIGTLDARFPFDMDGEKLRFGVNVTGGQGFTIPFEDFLGPLVDSGRPPDHAVMAGAIARPWSRWRTRPT